MFKEESIYTPRPTVRMRRLWLNQYLPTLSIFGVFLLLFVIFSVTTESFLTTGNLINLLRQSGPNLVVAVGMTLVITTGGIDLSVGSIVALVSALSAIFLSPKFGLPWPLVIAMMVVLGAGVGGLNGWMVAYEGIPAFIVTLASLSIVRGVALLLTEGYSVPIASENPFVLIGRGTVGGIPLPALLGILAALLGIMVVSRLRLGQYIIGIGANEEAVRRAGVNTRLVKLSVYIISGITAAIAGIIVAARLGSGSSNAGVGFELDVITAVVLGGTDLFGGRGTIIGTVIGALIIGMVGNGLILAHVSPFYTQIVTGVILLAAIWFNQRIFSRFSFSKRK